MATNENREKCRRCAGTGEFITGMLNGRPTGPGGICYRCGGKGYQTKADERRNWGYDNYAFGAAASAMVCGSYYNANGEHRHQYEFSRYCGAHVCLDCRDHKGLVRCYCDWAASGGSGRRELVSMGETL